MSQLINGIKISGSGLIIIGAIQILVSVSIDSLINWACGSWWAGSVSLLCGCIAVSSDSWCVQKYTRPIYQAGFCLGVISLFASIVGIIFDASWYVFLDSLVACYNQNIQETYGDRFWATSAIVCATSNGYQCTCVQDKSDSDCYQFKVFGEDQDCGLLLSEIPDLLIISFVLCALLFTLSTIYSLLAFYLLNGNDAQGNGEGTEGALEAHITAGDTTKQYELTSNIEDLANREEADS
mmetsp:Transcript_30751/g.51452  ORF Transcript_30751/g.51452 Transcript_30751/m.51452 type:complete len:238 (-) Transcript_30751:68-781(-)